LNAFNKLCVRSAGSTLLCEANTHSRGCTTTTLGFCCVVMKVNGLTDQHTCGIGADLLSGMRATSGLNDKRLDWCHSTINESIKSRNGCSL
jgi:hypothetical protein